MKTTKNEFRKPKLHIPEISFTFQYFSTLVSTFLFTPQLKFNFKIVRFLLYLNTQTIITTASRRFIWKKRDIKTQIKKKMVET